MKKVATWLGGLGVVGILGAIFAVVLIFALIAGMMASVFGGVVGGILGDDAQSDDDQRCVVTPGPGDPITGTQEEYVRTMIGVAQALDVPERGQIVAVMTMLQESSIQNYANGGENHFDYDIGSGTGESTQWWLDTAMMSLDMPHDAVGNDADSVGLYQQRASAGWADAPNFSATDDPDTAIRRLMDPRWGAEAFFGGPDSASQPQGLLDISGWEDMPLGEAAQTVQGSAFPDAYDKWEDEATALVQDNQDADEVDLVGGGEGNGDDDDGDDGSSSSTEVEWPMAEGSYNFTSGYGQRDNPTGPGTQLHAGIDLAAPIGTPIYAPYDGTVAASGSVDAGYANWVVIDHDIDGSRYSTLYGHMELDSIEVEEGDSVSQGDQIAGVGNEGNSTGAHLHFEVWDGGRFDGGDTIDPEEWLENPNTGGGGDPECGDDEDSPVEAEGSVAAVIEFGEQEFGVDYSWGGGGLEGPTEGFGAGAGIVGYDCSSLMRYMIYNGTGQGLEIPRTTGEQYRHTQGNEVDWNDMEPGDLMFWSNNGSASGIYHVAMYVGNGEMIEAPQTGDVVKQTDVRQSNFYAATRIDYSSES